MRFLLILFFPIFMFAYSPSTGDCGCNGTWELSSTSSRTVTARQQSPSSDFSCIGTANESQVTSVEQIGDSYICPGSANSCADYKITYEQYTCEVCNEPDQTFQYDISLYSQPSNPIAKTCGDTPEDVQLKDSECSALGGFFFTESIVNCCASSICLVPIPENNCTAPYVQDPATNECVCDTSSGYSVDTKTGECTDCPNTYECVLSADNSNGTFTNIYEVTDCNGVNYAEKTVTEDFNCMNKDCSPGYYYCDISDKCEPNGTECLANSSDDNDTSTCDYPATMFGAPFQGIMSLNDCFSHNGWTSFCDDFTVACYYQDTNNTDSDNSDSTSSDTDDNTTSTIDDNLTTDANGTIVDTTNIENKLDQIIAELSPTGTINHSLGDLSNSINNNFMSLSDKLDAINTNQGAKLDTVGTKIDSATSSLGSKLDGINRNLEDIKDKFDSDLNVDTSDLDSALESAKQVYEDALVSFETSANDIRSLLNGSSAPAVTASGDCILSGSTTHIGGFQFDFSVLSELRVGFQFFLNLMLIFFTIKLYTAIARDIIKYVSGVS